MPRKKPVDDTPAAEAEPRKRKGPKGPSLTPHMSEAELACFTRHIADVKRYLEFGCGGSTVWAARAGARQIVSIESDPAWIAKCRKARELKGVDVAFLHVDIGETGDWGKPVDALGAARWPGYSGAGWDLFSTPPDFVFVDGRFRVACGLHAVLRAPPSTRIAVHDFWNRPAYYELLNFCDLIEAAETLAVLRPRQTVDWKALALALSRRLLDSR